MKRIVFLLGIGLLLALAWFLQRSSAWHASAVTEEAEDPSAAVGQASGRAEPSRHEDKDAEVIRDYLVGREPFRARVVDASGAPVARCLVGVLPARPGAHRYSAPAFDLFGTWHAIHDRLRMHSGAREVETDDGWITLPDLVDRRAALFVAAPQRAVLFAVGEPFGGIGAEPVLVLHPIEQRRIRVLDHDTEGPVIGARLTLRRTRGFDYVSKLRSSYGAGVLDLPFSARTGLETDAAGLLDVPLMVHFAVYDSARESVFAAPYVAGPFTVDKSGYVHGEVQQRDLATDTEHRLYLDSAGAALRVRVVDEGNRPIRVALLFDCRRRQGVHLGCFTDDRGECFLRDFPPGETQVRIFVPARTPRDMPAGELLPQRRLFKFGLARPDRRTVILEAGATFLLEHRMGTKPPRLQHAFVFGSIRRGASDHSITLRVRSGPIRITRGLRGEEFEQKLTPGVASELRIQHKLEAVTLTQAIRISPLAAGARRRVDIEVPGEDHLVRFAGHVELAALAEHLLPDAIHMQLVRDDTDAGRFEAPRTESIDVFNRRQDIRSGAKFSVELAPGRYRIYANYRPDPRRTHSLWFQIGAVAVAGPINDARLVLPAISRIRFRLERLDAGPTPPLRQSMLVVRSFRTGEWHSKPKFLSTGRFELLHCARGFEPVRSTFEVRATSETIVPIRLRAGLGAVLRGTVLESDGARPTTRSVYVDCTLVGIGKSWQGDDARMGRFEFTGLLAGEYELKVSENRNPRIHETYRFRLAAGQVRKGLRLRLPQRK